MSNQEPIVLDLTTTEVPVTLGGVAYVLCEADGETACKYRNEMMARSEMVDGHVVRLHDMADLEPLLVSRCLRLANTRERVSEATVKSWPARVQKVLFERVKEISDLGDRDAAKEQAKNSQIGKTVGSD